MTTEMISSKALWQSTAAAVVIGTAALVTLIMPAEYNIDPTGIGSKLGLTALSPEGLAAAQEAEIAEAPTVEGASSDIAQLVVPPNSGIEYKMIMQAGDQLNFEWSSDGAPVYMDMHGEPKGDTTGYFLSYAIANLTEMEGSFIAAFEGTHGWYFKNETDEPVNIELFFDGKYADPHQL